MVLLPFLPAIFAREGGEDVDTSPAITPYRRCRWAPVRQYEVPTTADRPSTTP